MNELSDFLSEYGESSVVTRKRALKGISFAEKFELRTQVREQLKASSGSQERLLKKIYQELNRDLFGLRSLSEVQPNSKRRSSEVVSRVTQSSFRELIQTALHENQNM